MIIIAGTVRVPADRVSTFRPHMQAMISASRIEEGCLDYRYAEDVLEPGLIQVFELWRDQSAINAHFAAPHLAAWRAVWPQFGVSERRLIAYEVASQHEL